MCVTELSKPFLNSAGLGAAVKPQAFLPRHKPALPLTAANPAAVPLSGPI